MSDLVQVIPLALHADDRGELAELQRCDDRDFAGYGQVYAVRSYTKGTIRGLHRHEKLWDHFIIVRGAAKFRFFDDKGHCQEVTASERVLTRIAVPPHVWHGWVALEDNTLLISVASEPYCGQNRCGQKDEERVAFDFFDGDPDAWAVTPR